MSSVVRRLSTLGVFVLLGGCALLTGANDLEVEKSTSNSTLPPEGSGTGIGTGTGTTSSSGGIPGLDGGGFPFPFGDGGSSSSGGGPTLDGGVFPDGSKPDPRAGISCGNATCAPGGHCCSSALGMYQCSASCGGAFGDLTCDDAYDCPGKVCCGTSAGSVVGTTKCLSSCGNDANAFIMCGSDQDCPAPMKCQLLESAFPGSKYRACTRN